MAKGGGKTTGRAPPAFADAPVTTDPRFAKVHTDPRFLKPKRDDTKVVVDERFKGLFEDDKSSGKKGKKTDKYGRKIGKGQSDADQMKRFYRLEDVDLAAEEEDSENDADGGAVDYARGEGDLESSSEEESSDDEKDDDESGDSDSEEDDSEEDDVMIGPSSVLDRERRKKAARSARFDDEDDDDDDGLGSDIGDIDLDEDVDEAVYAQLDAQAERAIAEGGIEDDDESDSDADASASRKKGKGKEKARKKPKTSKQKIPRGDDTCRLAAVNLDWDHVRAKDIYKVFSSIVSPLATITAADALQAHRRAAATGNSASTSSRARGAPAISQVRGKLLHVRVYPSDFGKERMAKEDLEGPPAEIFKGAKRRSSRTDSSDDEEVTAKTIVQVDDGGEFDEEALRTYQLDRLRYYYAVATFDSKETARHVYNEIDGTEMERTANVFDLRFVPDGMEFADGEAGREAEFRDEATEDVANYKGVDFKTDALRHSRVKLTWDQDDPERSKLTRMVARGGLTKEQLRDDDFRAYLASDTESEPDAEQLAAQNGRDRLRALLNLDGGDEGGFGKKGKRNGGVFDDPRRDEDEQGEMQITFMPGLSEAAAKKAAGGAGNKGAEDETTLEKYLRKQKEKKERKKARRGGGDGEEAEDKKDEDAVDGAIGSTDAGFDDPFFNQDVDMEAALAAEFGDAAPTTKKSSKKTSSKKSTSGQDTNEDPAELARQRQHLTTLIGDTNDELTQDGRQHFDMKDILRHESGKDAKRAKLLKRLSKKKQRKEQAFQERKGAPLVQDTFAIDARDDRFSALMDDHRFAIDPTHPGFAKTKAMQTIMDERRRRLDRAGAEEMPGKSEGRETSKEGDVELSALVEKLKRRSDESAGEQSAKRRRKRKSNA
ncbi:related to ESF1-18S rRNA factor, nucleolar protein involved in pre-rRNA processing [Sporisorium reilianum SRZ2]|uniref:Related to ESF1-18S rRNA factor, nucleolar protein involved in pre-rRNA processing n=1 Tax=Sporisorium reilianum (strain SRZ2) TaxID=999809 RepID=E6ZJT3_SPORE|nr:related to ESF1-18S rRNA factor, nucleolar protein involved in pre-rRNA processing [Sporisorium reilianum SRZ2]